MRPHLHVRPRIKVHGMAWDIYACIYILGHIFPGARHTVLAELPWRSTSTQETISPQDPTRNCLHQFCHARCNPRVWKDSCSGTTTPCADCDFKDSEGAVLSATKCCTQSMPEDTAACAAEIQFERQHLSSEQVEPSGDLGMTHHCRLSQ